MNRLKPTSSLFVVLVFLALISEYRNLAALHDALYRSDGRLGQVELAIKASDRGGSVIAAKNQRYAVAVAWTPMSDMELPVDKIQRLTRSTAIVSSGIQADANFIIDKFQRDLLSETYVFDVEKNPTRIAKDISNYMHSHTRYSDYRPFGIRVCLVAYDEARKSPCVYEIDPYGYLYDCQMVGIGAMSETMLSHFDINALDQLNLSGLIRKCFDAMTQSIAPSSTGGERSSIDPKHVEVVIVGENIHVSRLSSRTIQSLLQTGEIEDDAIILDSLKSISY